ncbi:MAG: winged helix-turn-helix transcriptional regulator [Halobellus sp.]|uniref:winged helix-turn-helix transcriptional regulator n=1 Tax=Halobellus sp. TaxID=1979212 RepID=UPI0035D49074
MSRPTAVPTGGCTDDAALPGRSQHLGGLFQNARLTSRLQRVIRTAVEFRRFLEASVIQVDSDELGAPHEFCARGSTQTDRLGLEDDQRGTLIRRWGIDDPPGTGLDPTPERAKQFQWCVVCYVDCVSLGHDRVGRKRRLSEERPVDLLSVLREWRGPIVRTSRLEVPGDELVENDVVGRRMEADAPVAVSYDLTTRGEELLGALDDLDDWARDWGDEFPEQEPHRLSNA